MHENNRCHWVNLNSEIYVKYHDEEWGVAVYDDKKLYELFLLETFQAGLSWLTILKKRENFKKAFDKFDVEKIAHYDEEKFQLLMQDTGIIRNKAKIRAAIENAKIFIDIQKEYGSFSNYLWGFTKNKTVFLNSDKLPTSTLLSDTLSNDLYTRGMRFVGSVTIYSYLQAIGVVNDHEEACFCHRDNK